MPYIKQDRKNKITPVLKGDDGFIRMDQIQNTGELNYALTSLIVNYLKLKGLNYQTINDIVGTLTCAKDEFQRRVTLPYENTKIYENGDVYTDYMGLIDLSSKGTK